MARRKFHDWPALTSLAADLIRTGKCQPLYMDLADALGIPRPTLDAGLRRLGITADLLATPDRWPEVKARAVSRPREAGVPTPAAHFHGIAAADVVKHLRDGPLALEALANRLDRGQDAVALALEAMAQAGYGVVREETTVKLPRYTPPARAPVLLDGASRHVRFAVASDWYIASKAAQVSALRAFLDVAVKKHECEHILVPGDVCAGYGVYRGQANEVYAIGADDQLDALINTVPEYKGVQFYVLGGNHDYSFIKTSGFNIVDAACRRRADWTYLGFDEATVPLTESLDIVLWHPSGGVPYALSYRGQKFAAELAQRELADIIVGKKERPRTRFVFWGHLHVADSFPYGPIRVTGPGCFEGRNSYLKQKGLTPQIQGIVVEAWLTDEGLIQRHVAHEYSFIEQEDDWKTAYQPALARRGRERVVPLYRLKESKAQAGRGR